MASVIVLCCVFWAGAVDGVGFHEGGKLLNVGGLPTTISLFTFCYCGHAVFPTLCNSMKDRSQFSKVLLVCFVTSTINYGSMAILGYLMYGENSNSQVTLNLPIRKINTKIAIYATLVNPLAKYAVIITPIADAIEYKFPSGSSRLISVLIRTAIVISTAVVALTVPFFGYVMAFVGAFLSVTTSMLLPCLCYLKINKTARSFGLELIIIVGILWITPIADAIEYKFPSGSSRLISVLIRTAIVISTAVVALTVPFFGYVMAFVGAFLSVTTSMLLPCLCYLKINKTARSFGLELIIIVGILVIGSFVGVVGTYTL
ncbi:amino acid transporter avt1i [Quercus suber]|uniref:Amino acid transporter avt1i n=1 Tax=Quercus suber TaxID=58331 RepID=A0AAW0KHR9_QUESU